MKIWFVIPLFLVCAGCIEAPKEVVHRHGTGVVLAKVHTDKTYLNPIDNLNPMRDVDPTFDMKDGRFATMTPQRNIVSIDVEGVTLATDDKQLFDSTRVGARVAVTFDEWYGRDKKDPSVKNLIERQIISAIPEK